MDPLTSDLAALGDHAVVVYGSRVRGEATHRSDVDVAVVSFVDDVEANRALWRQLLGRVGEPFDVKVYELLPLHVQADIVERYDVVFGNAVAISMRFYEVRRRWKDVAPRLQVPPLDARERVRRLRAQTA